MLNPALRVSLAAGSVLSLLESSTAHARHVYLTGDFEIAAMLRPFAPCLRGHKQVTDAYLIALAAQHYGVLVTMDRGASALAAAAGYAASVELISA